MEVRSDEMAVESLQFGEEIQRLISAPVEAGSSFTALLELPPNQAVKLLHLPEESPAKLPGEVWINHRVDEASMFTNSIPSNSDEVKREPVELDSRPNLSMIHNSDRKSNKRKETEKKVKEQAKKSKNAVNENDGEKLPYVHVRARRGQATDSHSLAERARREKINARMKLLQELVPGCNKISGTAMVLDEIINHVQSLQRQVEFLSMRLAAVNPRNDVNFDSLFAAEQGSMTEINNNMGGMVMPSMWIEGQVMNGNRLQDQQQQQLLWHFDGLHNHNQSIWCGENENPNFIPSENNSLLTYDSSANSDQYIGMGSMQMNKPKMEL